MDKFFSLFANLDAYDIILLCGIASFVLLLLIVNHFGDPNNQK